MRFGSVSMKEAYKILELDKHDFDGVFKSECCGSTIGRGNSMYDINQTGHSGTETEVQLCTKCVKIHAWCVYNR